MPIWQRLLITLAIMLLASYLVAQLRFAGQLAGASPRPHQRSTGAAVSAA